MEITVLFRRLRGRHERYAIFPTATLTYFGTESSKSESPFVTHSVDCVDSSIDPEVSSVVVEQDTKKKSQFSSLKEKLSKAEKNLLNALFWYLIRNQVELYRTGKNDNPPLKSPNIDHAYKSIALASNEENFLSATPSTSVPFFQFWSSKWHHILLYMADLFIIFGRILEFHLKLSCLARTDWMFAMFLKSFCISGSVFANWSVARWHTRNCRQLACQSWAEKAIFYWLLFLTVYIAICFQVFSFHVRHSSFSFSASFSILVKVAIYSRYFCW